MFELITRMNVVFFQVSRVKRALIVPPLRPDLADFIASLDSHKLTRTPLSQFGHGQNGLLGPAFLSLSGLAIKENHIVKLTLHGVGLLIRLQ
jgi:hypothetical protein